MPTKQGQKWNHIIEHTHTVITNSMHSKWYNIWLIVVVGVAVAAVFVLEIIIACEFGYLLKWW